MARAFLHPARKEITIDGVLHALADPVRRGIVAKLLSCDEGLSCKAACDLPPSSISFHHKVLREAGIIRSKKIGVEVMNSLRREDLEKRFPALLEAILQHHRERR